MKVWITKYALTKGIYEAEGRVSDVTADMFVPEKSYSGFFKHTSGTDDWAERKDDAIKIAEEMRVKKIASLKKQVEKLEKLKFE